MFNCIERKINVFISSEINGLTEFRQNLKFLLFETGLVNEAYVFEKTGASTASCQKSYLNEIPKCDLFILIIKNSNGLSPQIKLEYNTALASNKKILIFFYNDSEGICDFKAQIIKEPTHYGKYAESNNLFDLQQLIYKSFIEDVLSNYTDNNLYGNEEKKTLNDSQYTIFHNEYIKNLKDNNGILEFINKTESYDISDDLTKYLNEFFNVVLCNKKYSENSFKMLKDKIRLNYPDKLKNILLKKLDAAGLYFSGNINLSIEKLKKLLDLIKNNNDVHEWIKNDILIDLRNLQYLNHNYQDNIQKMIQKSKESVFYPELDRLSSNIEKNIRENISKSVTESPYVITLGGDRYTFNLIKKYFYISVFYGSITHILLVRKFLSDYLESLSMLTSETSLYSLMIKYKLLAKEFSSLKSINRNIQLNDFRQKNINLEEIFNAINLHEHEDDKINILFCFAELYSDSFSDKLYNKVIKQIKTIIKNKKLYLNEITSLINILSNCCNRLSIKDLLYILNDCISVLHIPLSRMLKIFENIDYTRFTSNKYVKAIKTLLINNINFDDTQSLHCAFYFCVNKENDASDLINLIKTRNASYFNKYMIINLSSVDYSLLALRIKDEISNIKKIISLEKNVIEYYGESCLKILDSILKQRRITLDRDTKESLINNCIEIIKNKRVKTSDRIAAIALLLNNFDHTIFSAEKFLSSFDAKIELSRSPFEHGDNEAYDDIIYLSKCIVSNKAAKISKINNLSSIAKIKVLSFCSSIIEKAISYDSQMKYCFCNLFEVLVYDEETDVRFLSLKCLLQLYRIDVTLIDLNLIEYIIKSNNRFLKHLIISQFEILDSILPIEYKLKLFGDNSWSVRNHATNKIKTHA